MKTQHFKLTMFALLFILNTAKGIDLRLVANQTPTTCTHATHGGDAQSVLYETGGG